MDLSTNRPITGTRDLSLLALMYLPSHFYRSLSPCTIVSVTSGYSIFLGYAVHIPVLFVQTFCSNHPLSLECFLVSLEVLPILQILVYVLILETFLPNHIYKFLTFQTSFKYWGSQDSVFGPLFVSCYWVTLVSDFIHPHDFQLPLK